MPELNVTGPAGFFPRKGRRITSGSLVEMAIQDRRPYFTPCITLLDNMEDEGLVAIARPLLVSGIVAKVALVVLLTQDTGLLKSQIERVRPNVVKGFHRHL